MDGHQRDRLHGEDERLVDSALTRFVPSLEPAPNGHECPRKPGEAARETAEKARASVRERAGPKRRHRPRQQEIAAISDEQASNQVPIHGGLKMQQQIDARWHAEKAACQKDREAAPVDVAPKSDDAEQLDCDAADDHHLHGSDRTVHEVK